MYLSISFESISLFIILNVVVVLISNKSYFQFSLVLFLLLDFQISLALFLLFKLYVVVVVVPISNASHFQNWICEVNSHAPLHRTFKLAMLIKPFRLQKNVYFPVAPINNMRLATHFCLNIYDVQGKLRNNKLKIINSQLYNPKFIHRTF